MTGTVEERASSRSHQPKPPRLRAACNQCNAAKVKCSGERTGCSRCTSIRVQCLYVESRVGKVQGVRTKRKKAQPESIQSDDGTSSRSNSIQTQIEDEDASEEREAVGAEVSVSELPSPKRYMPDSQHQLQQQSWSPGSWSWNDNFLALDGPISFITDTGNTMDSGSTETPDIHLASSTSTSGLQSHLPSIDCGDIGNLNTRSSSQTLPVTSVSQQTSTTTPAPQPIEPISSQRRQSMAITNSRCVIALANIAITLENYLLSNLNVLDLIINSVRSVAQEMRKIALNQQELRSERCMFLSVTIMYQVVELLETGSKAVLETNAAEQSHAGASDGLVSFMPQLGFGALSTFNDEEQRSMKMHIIRKECQNMDEILGQLMMLARLGPRGSTSATPTELEERTRCFIGLQHRLKELSNKAEGNFNNI